MNVETSYSFRKVPEPIPVADPGAASLSLRGERFLFASAFSLGSFRGTRMRGEVMKLQSFLATAEQRSKTVCSPLSLSNSGDLPKPEVFHAGPFDFWSTRYAKVFTCLFS